MAPTSSTCTAIDVIAPLQGEAHGNAATLNTSHGMLSVEDERSKQPSSRADGNLGGPPPRAPVSPTSFCPAWGRVPEPKVWTLLHVPNLWCDLTIVDRDIDESRGKARGQWRRLTWTLRVWAAALIVAVVVPTIGTSAFNPVLLGVFLGPGVGAKHRHGHRTGQYRQQTLIRARVAPSDQAAAQ